jgi:hypothetical protein
MFVLKDRATGCFFSLVIVHGFFIFYFLFFLKRSCGGFFVFVDGFFLSGRRIARMVVAFAILPILGDPWYSFWTNKIVSNKSNKTVKTRGNFYKAALNGKRTANQTKQHV